MTLCQLDIYSAIVPSVRVLLQADAQSYKRTEREPVRLEYDPQEHDARLEEKFGSLGFEKEIIHSMYV